MARGGGTNQRRWHVHPLLVPLHLLLLLLLQPLAARCALATVSLLPLGTSPLATLLVARCALARSAQW